MSQSAFMLLVILGSHWHSLITTLLSVIIIVIILAVISYKVLLLLRGVELISQLNIAVIIWIEELLLQKQRVLSLMEMYLLL